MAIVSRGGRQIDLNQGANEGMGQLNQALAQAGAIRAQREATALQERELRLRAIGPQAEELIRAWGGVDAARKADPALIGEYESLIGLDWTPGETSRSAEQEAQFQINQNARELLTSPGVLGPNINDPKFQQLSLGGTPLAGGPRIPPAQGGPPPSQPEVVIPGMPPSVSAPDMSAAGFQGAPSSGPNVSDVAALQEAERQAALQRAPQSPPVPGDGFDSTRVSSANALIEGTPERLALQSFTTRMGGAEEWNRIKDDERLVRENFEQNMSEYSNDFPRAIEEARARLGDETRGTQVRGQASQLEATAQEPTQEAEDPVTSFRSGVSRMGEELRSIVEEGGGLPPWNPNDPAVRSRYFQEIDSYLEEAFGRPRVSGEVFRADEENKERVFEGALGSVRGAELDWIRGGLLNTLTQDNYDLSSRVQEDGTLPSWGAQTWGATQVSQEEASQELPPTREASTPMTEAASPYERLAGRGPMGSPQGEGEIDPPPVDAPWSRRINEALETQYTAKEREVIDRRMNLARRAWNRMNPGGREITDKEALEYLVPAHEANIFQRARNLPLKAADRQLERIGQAISTVQERMAEPVTTAIRRMDNHNPRGARAAIASVREETTKALGELRSSQDMPLIGSAETAQERLNTVYQAITENPDAFSGIARERAERDAITENTTAQRLANEQQMAFLYGAESVPQIRAEAVTIINRLQELGVDLGEEELIQRMLNNDIAYMNLMNPQADPELAHQMYGLAIQIMDRVQELAGKGGEEEAAQMEQWFKLLETLPLDLTGQANVNRRWYQFRSRVTPMLNRQEPDQAGPTMQADLEARYRALESLGIQMPTVPSPPGAPTQ